MNKQKCLSITLFAVTSLSGAFRVPCAAQDYAVTRHNVTFESRGTTLAGTLWLPDKRGPHPAIVTVHGSGRTTRNDPYQRQTAEHFSKRGVAVLSFDKRGTGQSEGTYAGSYSSSMVIYAMDALAAVAHLKTRDDIDGGQIGLWGTSQAGWIIPIAATVVRGDIAFTIIVSGPTVSIAEENYYSELTGDDPMKPTNLSRAEISRRLKTIDGYFEAMDTWLFGHAGVKVP